MHVHVHVHVHCVVLVSVALSLSPPLSLCLLSPEEMDCHLSGHWSDLWETQLRHRKPRPFSPLSQFPKCIHMYSCICLSFVAPHNQEPYCQFQGKKLQTYAGEGSSTLCVLSHSYTVLLLSELSLHIVHPLVGHKGSVRCLAVSDSEHFFISSSKDKTVKLWSLKNQGNGSTHISPYLTYSRHQKSVSHVELVTATGNAISCDGTVHVSWFLQLFAVRSSSVSFLLFLSRSLARSLPPSLPPSLAFCFSFALSLSRSLTAVGSRVRLLHPPVLVSTEQRVSRHEAPVAPATSGHRGNQRSHTPVRSYIYIPVVKNFYHQLESLCTSFQCEGSLTFGPRLCSTHGRSSFQQVVREISMAVCVSSLFNSFSPLFVISPPLLPSPLFLNVGILRCLTCGDNWVAVGNNTGTINTLDLRMGELLNQWKPSDFSLILVRGGTCIIFTSKTQIFVGPL